MGRTPRTTESVHVKFARQFGIEVRAGSKLEEVFDDIVKSQGYQGLVRLRLRAKRSLVHQAATIPAYRRPWFEKNCTKSFKKNSIKIARAMQHAANHKTEVAALWDFFRKIPEEQRTAIGGSPSAVFYKTHEWRKFRYMFISCFGAKCMACGATPKQGAVIEVDHIRPRHLYPEIAFRPDNLQILCEDCHAGKGQGYTDSWANYSRIGGMS